MEEYSFEKNIGINKDEKKKQESEIFIKFKKFIEKYSMPMESIIPGSNIAGLNLEENRYGKKFYVGSYIEDSNESFAMGHGSDAETLYIDGPIQAVYECENSKEFLAPLKNTVVLDLGAGDGSGYFFAAMLGAKGYIGVDKFKIPQVESVGKERLKETKAGPLRIKDIPFAVVKEDLLDFLKRIPDNSVSILTSAMIEGFREEYKRAVEREIVRVLDPEGAYVSHNSSFAPEGLIRSKLEDKDLLFGGLLKFTKK